MPRHAVATIPVLGHTCSLCYQIEHRELNLTTSSPSFRIPSAHIIFVPSPGTLAPGMSMCILCNITVSRDAQESHLSGKRHARIMKHTRGPRACTCPAPVPALQPGAAVMKSRIKRLRVVRKRRGRRPRRAPRHKRRRCARRSSAARLMKIGRSGLFSKYVRDREYHIRPSQNHEIIVQRKTATLPMGSFPQKKRYSTTPTSATPRRHPLDRADLRAPHSRHTGAHLLEQCTAVLWPIHQGRPGLPQRLTLRWPSLHRSEKVLAAPSLTITKDQGGEPIKRKSDTQDSARKIDVQKSGMRKASPKIASAPKTGARRTSAQEAQNDSWRAGTQKAGTQNAGVQKAGTQKVGKQKVGKQKVGTRTAGSVQPAQDPKTKPKTKLKKKPQQKWHCDVCDKSMASGSMEDHLRGVRHVRKAARMQAGMLAS